MKKTLSIIAVCAGIACVVSAVIFAFIYVEDTFGFVRKRKKKAAKKRSCKSCGG